MSQHAPKLELFQPEVWTAATLASALTEVFRVLERNADSVRAALHPYLELCAAENLEAPSLSWRGKCVSFVVHAANLPKPRFFSEAWKSCQIGGAYRPPGVEALDREIVGDLPVICLPCDPDEAGSKYQVSFSMLVRIIRVLDETLPETVTNSDVTNACRSLAEALARCDDSQSRRLVFAVIQRGENLEFASREVSDDQQVAQFIELYRNAGYRVADLHVQPFSKSQQHSIVHEAAPTGPRDRDVEKI